MKFDGIPVTLVDEDGDERGFAVLYQTIEGPQVVEGPYDSLEEAVQLSAEHQ